MFAMCVCVRACVRVYARVCVCLYVSVCLMLDVYCGKISHLEKQHSIRRLITTNSLS